MTIWRVLPSPVASGPRANRCRAVDTLVSVYLDSPASTAINVRLGDIVRNPFVHIKGLCDIKDCAKETVRLFN